MADAPLSGGRKPPVQSLTSVERPTQGAYAPRSGLLAAALFTAFAVVQALTPGTMPDFFIFRLGAALTARGESPYDIPKVRAEVAKEFPDPDLEPKPESFLNNCGYFLPPQAAVLFLPFAMLPWPYAKVAWALLQGLAGFAIATLPNLWRTDDVRRAATGRERASLVPKLVPFLLLLNFLTLAVVMVGQFAVVFVGCVAAGLWCFARGDRLGAALGVLLWSVAFVKPHVALPLITLAWYLGGWKRAAALVGVVAAFNLIGATLVGGSPLFLRDYLDYLGGSFRAVMFNRAELNYEMTSWNRLLYVATQPFAGDRFLIEQTAKTAVASYLVWFGLVLGRCGIAGVKPSAAWALAATAAGAVWCPQVLGYEALALALAVPWVQTLFADGRRAYGFAAVLLLGLQAIPFQALDKIGFDFHRPLGVALFAVLVLVAPIKKASGAA